MIKFISTELRSQLQWYTITPPMSVVDCGNEPNCADRSGHCNCSVLMCITVAVGMATGRMIKPSAIIEEIGGDVIPGINFASSDVMTAIARRYRVMIVIQVADTTYPFGEFCNANTPVVRMVRIGRRYYLSTACLRVQSMLPYDCGRLLRTDMVARSILDQS